MGQRPIAELAQILRAQANHRFKPPFASHAAPLTDVQIHAQDIRRPLGLPAVLVPERVRVALDFLVNTRAIGFTPRRLVAGLRFEAVDLDWVGGDGSLVQGPGEALMLALTGRVIVLPELTGPGAAVLASRLRS
jgi:uncharacterized protein (TIGR03083 family)